jgi:predicted transcriptional regulator
MLEEKLNEKKVEELMREPEIILSPNEQVSSVIGKMRKNNIYSLPVVKENNYFGFLEAQEIVGSNINPESTKIETLMTYPPTIASHASLIEAIEKMWRNNLRTIPIVTHKKVRGVLNFWDIVDWCLDQEEFKKKRVQELESKEIPKIRKHEEVDQAIVEIKEKDIVKLLIQGREITDVLGTKEIINQNKTRPKERMTLGERKGEKDKRTSIESRTISRPIKVRTNKKESIHKLLKEMKKLNYDYAVLGNSIITFRDILSYLKDFKIDMTQRVIFASKIELDPFVMDQISSDLKSFLETYHKKFSKNTIKEFRIGIESTNKNGKNEFYEISAKLLTDMEDYYAKKDGWDPLEVFNDALAAIRKQIWD